MKTNIRLINAKSLFLLLSVSVFLFSSCNNENNQEESFVSNEEAVEVIESAFSFGTQGITDGITGAALVARIYSEKSGNNDFCGVPFDSTLSIQLTLPAVSADYTTSFGWTVNCNNINIPQTLDFQRTASGSYETNRSMGTNQISSSWTIGNLIGGNNWSFSGTYNSSGTFKSKVREQNELNNSFEMSLNDVQVSKDFYSIVSGEGTFTLLLSNGQGNSQSFEGGIVFLGNSQATLTLNGNSFDLDWR